MSTDNSVEVIKREIKGDDRFKLIVNKEKSLALKNIYDGINISNPSPENIILTLDGDDWLSSKDVLKKIDDIYNTHNCWITYGSYAEYPNNQRGKFARQIPQHVIDNNSYRNFEWCSSHLRTFKYHLWNKIEKEDLLDTEGNFYRMAWDLSFMLPMLEMAGNRSHYIPEIMYIYNLDNPLNDHKVDNIYQVSLEREIRQKKEYNLIYENEQTFFRWSRFDLPIKKIFLKFYDGKINSNFGEQIYKEHLRVWNNFKEYDNPSKNTYECFRDDFVQIYKDIKSGHFDWNKSPVVVDHAGYLLNGSHRAAAASCASIMPAIKQGKNIQDGQKVCDYQMFKSLDLADDYLDAAALELARNNKSLVLAHIFPSAIGHQDAIESILRENSNIAYKKEIFLSTAGALNYTFQLYRGEKWAGDWNNNFAGFREKTSLCFTTSNPMTVYLLEPFNNTSSTTIKNQVRHLFNIGNHSIHINDTYEETLRLSRCLFNTNSIHFLNNARPQNYKKFLTWVKYYEKYIIDNNLDFENYCITASGVLSLYGLREASDLDYLHSHTNIIVDLGDNIHSHNEYGVGRYKKNIDDIIYNPQNHFYFGNIKAASLDIIFQLKKDRAEPKDYKDLKLISEVL